MAKTEDKTDSEATLPLLRAIVLLLLDSREQPGQQSKPEVLLHRAGLDNKEISKLLGKKEDAVRKAIVRAK